MKLNPELMRSLAFALGLPSTIFTVAFIMMKLVKGGVISPTFGMIVFVVVVGNSLFLMVWYARKNKN